MNQELLAYKKVNYVLAGVILAIFLYSGLFSYEKNNFPLHSYHDKGSNTGTISTGLSRSFSAITRLDFQQAIAFNKYGLRIFLFFLFQLFLRVFFLVFIRKDNYEIRHLIILDFILSTGMFLFAFKPFLIDLFNY